DAPSERFVVTAGDETWHAAHLVAGMGLRPSLPDGVVEGPRVWHTEHLLPGLSTVEPGDLGRVLVVGSGQSAAEAVRHLLGDSPASTVTAVLQSYGYAPADDSPFVNAVFDPEGVDDFYDASPSARDRVLRAHRNTNYSVVDPELIDELARLEYAERRRDRPRFVVRNLTSLVSVRELDETPGAERFGHVACGGAPHARSGAGVGADGAVEAELLDLRTGERSTERVDAVVLATGYRPAMLSALVDDADGVFANLTDGVPDLDRSYRARLRNDVSGAMWMHGADERVHGLSSSLLSNIAVRGGEIARAIAAALAEPGRGEASVPPVVRDRDADRGDAESIEQIGTMARAASIEHAGAAR
ncbi:MAG: SidA/IucD/PvdA family monooxygenase, partial [Pseudoclavibacter sp.]